MEALLERGVINDMSALQDTWVYLGIPGYTCSGIEDRVL